MLQKTIWSRYLIIGINIIFLTSFSCCDKMIEENTKTVNYIYKNNTGIDLTMEVYNSNYKMINSYVIPNGKEVETNITKDEAPSVFHFENTVNKIGSSIILRFNDNKCLTYTNHNPDKIFNIKEYDNYSDELFKQNKFTLYFTFKEVDYNNSIICK